MIRPEYNESSEHDEGGIKENKQCGESGNKAAAVFLYSSNMADSLHSNLEVGQKVSFGGFSIQLKLAYSHLVRHYCHQNLFVLALLGVILCNSYYWYGVVPKNESDGRFSEDVVSEEVEVGDVKWLAGISLSIANVCNFNSIAYICPTLSSPSNDKGTNSKDHRITSLSLFASITPLYSRVRKLRWEYSHIERRGVSRTRRHVYAVASRPQHFPVSLVETVFHEPSLAVPNSPYKLLFLSNIRNKNSIQFHYHQMRTLLSRLIHSTPSISRLKFRTTAVCGRNLCTDSNKVDEPFKTEEAETVNVPPPPTEKLLVLGGNGFVGSHICREALERGLSVASISRSGRSSLHDSWAGNVTWYKGNILSTDSLKEALNGVTAVISCVGGFGSNSYMYKINGTANINAIRAASDQGVKRFVYISAADFGVVNYLLQGYYQGKVICLTLYREDVLRNELLVDEYC
ncbi:uncharacterized protein HKW66_Vig0097740 [Vigna angularis]|uniref:NAD(P)-binding domain-containing protein n=1 Tax=Phaseolus angularis TaxID=3914 RepID=A0A8T0KMQ8_PHAAN|nr:uncharacterized protein HKW66_Vig0097740 [Vigna angularis]